MNPGLDPNALSASAKLANARRVTIKIGSSLLVDEEGKVRRDWLRSVAADVSMIRERGQQVLVVSSGAVALGRRHLKLRDTSRLDFKQASAAAGQALLMQAWETACCNYGIPTAQLLLTIDDSEQRRRWLNARATLAVLLAQSALPVINENDSVATDELRYGDNDRLSARAAQMTGSDLLVLLSDVDGLYSADPRRDRRARHIAYVEEIDSVRGFAGNARGGSIGTGGMKTKLEAAAIASAFGCVTIIASGHEERPLSRIIAGANATVIVARGTPAGAYKQWIATALAPGGAVVVDDGAAKALVAGKSLLPAGVTAVEGQFQRGACLRVMGALGREVARGITAYDAQEARAIIGCGSDGIAARIGYRGPDELIHRNDLVLL